MQVTNERRGEGGSLENRARTFVFASQEGEKQVEKGEVGSVGLIRRVHLENLRKKEQKKEARGEPLPILL